MKKIGILTYHRSINYGAVLQAYALRYTIQKLGYNSEVIDYGKIGNNKLFLWSTGSIKIIAGSIINNFLRLFGEKTRLSKFKYFSENIIGISPKHYSDRDELIKDINNYDYIVTGSDQVWHPLICEDDMTYFLDLPISSHQKIAYAPSFGVKELTKEQEEKYKPLLQQIGNLSVREEAGYKILKSLLNKEVPIVVDPTLLCDAQEWDKIAVIPKRQKKYILFFTILGDPEGSKDFVYELSKKYNYDIIKIGDIRDLLNLKYKTGRYSSPQEFLGLVKNAEVVVTNSFHGTVFSIIYRKNFFTFLNNNDRNSRLETITQIFGLDSQLKKGKTKLPENITTNYQNVDLKIKTLKEQSIKFLKEALES